MNNHDSAKKELAKTLDYILNRCNERDIEVIAAAVIRRRRDITMFGSMPAAPDPRRMAEEISSRFNLDGGMESMRQSVRDYALRIIKQQAPELTDTQIDELMRAWVPKAPSVPSPDKQSKGSAETSQSELSVPREPSVPRELLVSMIDQFVSFSLGQMSEQENRGLRKEMGSWPDKYWKAFPQVIRLIITDFLKGEVDEKEFKTRLGLALNIS